MVAAHPVERQEDAKRGVEDRILAATIPFGLGQQASCRSPGREVLRHQGAIGNQSQPRPPAPAVHLGDGQPQPGGLQEVARLGPGVAPMIEDALPEVDHPEALDHARRPMVPRRQPEYQPPVRPLEQLDVVHPGQARRQRAIGSQRPAEPPRVGQAPADARSRVPHRRKRLARALIRLEGANLHEARSSPAGAGAAAPRG